MKILLKIIKYDKFFNKTIKITIILYNNNYNIFNYY